MSARICVSAFLIICLLLLPASLAQAEECVLDEEFHEANRLDLDEMCERPRDGRRSFADFLNVFGFREAGRGFALVIGISDYDRYNNLETHLDPIRMRNYLLGPGGFDYVHILTGEHVTEERISQLMVDVFADPDFVGPEDRFLFYWSGHGETFDQEDGDHGYLVLHDSEPEVFSTMYPMTSVLNLSRLIDADQALYLLDSCFSGLLLAQVKDGNFDELTQISIENFSGRARHVLTAGREGEQAIVDPARKGSVFTLAILEGLEKARANTWSDGHGRDQVVSFFELARYVGRETDEQRKVLNHDPEITPQWGHIGPRDGVFYFPLLGLIADPDEEINGLLTVQTHLDYLGYNPGPISGRLSTETQAAIAAFQQNSETRVTARPDRLTRARLLAAYREERRKNVEATAELAAVQT